MQCTLSHYLEKPISYCWDISLKSPLSLTLYYLSQVCRPTKKDKKRIGCGGHRCKFALMSFLKSFIHLEANKWDFIISPATGAVSVMCGSYSLKQNSFRTTWPPNQRPIVGIHNGISIVQPTQKESAYLSQDTHMNTAENKNLALNYSHITWQPRILAVLAPPRR